MGNIEELIGRNNRYGKNAVAALIAGTMIASSVIAPVSAYAQTQDLEENPLEQNADEQSEVIEEDDSQTPIQEEQPNLDTESDEAQGIVEEGNAEALPEESKQDTEKTEEIPSPDSAAEGESEAIINEAEDEPTKEDGTTKEDSSVKEDNNPVSQEPADKNAVDQNDVQQSSSPEVSPSSVASAEKISNSASVAGPSYNYSKEQTYVSHKYTEDMTTSSFVAAIAENARQIGQERDLYASVMIAQAILESGSGTSQLSQAPNNNLFGIKGVWYDEDGVGHKASFDTLEDDGTGTMYQIISDFRAYDTIADSMEDYADLLHDTENGMGNYYKGTWKSNTNSYKDACYSLQGTYATDTSYASKLIDIIETYELDRFDEKLGYEITGNIYDPENELSNEDGYRNLTMKDYSNLQAIATSQLGKDYVWGGETPEGGFDCSGLVRYVYKEALGVDITRTTYTQQYQGVEVPINDNDLRMGDLLFFADGRDVHHVGMYLGDGFYIHAPKPGDEVRITSMEDYTPDFAKRIVSFQDIDAE